MLPTDELHGLDILKIQGVSENISGIAQKNIWLL